MLISKFNLKQSGKNAFRETKIKLLKEADKVWIILLEQGRASDSSRILVQEEHLRQRNNESKGIDWHLNVRSTCREQHQALTLKHGKERGVNVGRLEHFSSLVTSRSKRMRAGVICSWQRWGWSGGGSKGSFVEREASCFMAKGIWRQRREMKMTLILQPCFPGVRMMPSQRKGQCRLVQQMIPRQL